MLNVELRDARVSDRNKFEIDAASRNTYYHPEQGRRHLSFAFRHSFYPLSILMHFFCLPWSPCCSSLTHSGPDSDSGSGDRHSCFTFHQQAASAGSTSVMEIRSVGKVSEIEYCQEYFSLLRPGRFRHLCRFQRQR